MRMVKAAMKILVTTWYARGIGEMAWRIAPSASLLPRRIQQYRKRHGINKKKKSIESMCENNGGGW